MSGFVSELVEDFSGSGGSNQQERFSESESYNQSSYGGGGGYGGGGYGGDNERFSESESYNQSSYGGGGFGGDNERFSETETYSQSSYVEAPPPPPECPFPWRPRWDDRSRRYVFIHQETGEEVWDFEEVRRRIRGGGGYYEVETSTTYYDQQGGGGGYGGGGYGGREERVYESEEVVDEQGRRGGGRHGLAYGAVGAAAGLAGGAYVMHEGEDIRQDYDYDKYRVENDVEDFPENVSPSLTLVPVTQPKPYLPLTGSQLDRPQSRRSGRHTARRRIRRRPLR